MNFAQMLKAEVQPLYDRDPADGKNARAEKMAEIAQRNTQRAVEKYRKAFGGKGKLKTGAELNRELNLQKASSFMKVLEGLGLAERVGKRPTGGSNPTIIWKWIGD